MEIEKHTHEWHSSGDPADLRLVLDHPNPPRPRSYTTQLLMDLKSWQCVVIWAFGIVPLILGIVYRQWIVTALGIYVFICYFRLLRYAVRLFREGSAVSGVIQNIKPGYRILGLSLAGAMLSDGSVVRVTVGTKVAKKLLEQYKRVEVLFLQSREAKLGTGIGLRPASAPFSEPEGDPG